MDTEKSPSQEESLVERALNLGWGPTRERLNDLAEQPPMQSLLGMLALQKRLQTLDDPIANKQLTELWTPAWTALYDTLISSKYSGLEISALVSIASELPAAE